MTRLSARHAWRPSLTVCLGGVVMQFHGLPVGLYNRLRDLLAPFEAASLTPAVNVSITRRQEPPLWLVAVDGASHHGFRSATDLLQYLEWLVVARAALATTQYAIIHAGAMTKEAMTILLVGDSGAGKTTVTMGLLQRGWLPLTDDIALVSPYSLAIAPFPRCFHADDFTASTIAHRALFEDVGSLKGYLRPVRWADTPARVSCLVRLARDAAAPTSAQPISQAEGAGALLQAAISTALPRREVARVAVGVTAGASCWQVNNGPLDDTLDTLERLAAIAHET
jgi:hypothetical protein